MLLYNRLAVKDRNRRTAVWAYLPAILFTVALAAGLLLVVAMPPLGGQDEVYHWLRVVQISSGHFLAEPMGNNAWGGQIDKAAYDYDLWLLAHFQQKQPINIGEAWSLAQQLGTLPPEKSLVEFSSTASFSPLAYLPQSLGVLLARTVGANRLVQIFAGRAANLICYLGFAAATLRLLPAGRRIFFALATMPTALHLAATLSADSLNFMLPALFLAWCWKSRYEAGRGPLFATVILAGLTVLLALLKPLSLIYAPFAAIIPADRFGGARNKIIAISSAVLIGALLCAAWNTAYPFVPGRYWHTGADPGHMIALILSDPANAARIALSTVRNWAPVWWLDSYGRFGGHPPPFSFYIPSFFLEITLFMALALCVSEGLPRKDWPVSAAATALAAGFAVLLLAAFWLGYTQPGSPTIDGIQGRYFYVFYMLASIAIIAASPLGSRVQRLRAPLLYGFLLVDGLSLSMALRHFHPYWHG